MTNDKAQSSNPPAKPAQHSPEEQPTRLPRLRESNGGQVAGRSSPKSK